MSEAPRIKVGSGVVFFDEHGEPNMSRCVFCGAENWCVAVASGTCAFCLRDARAHDGVKAIAVHVLDYEANASACGIARWKAPACVDPRAEEDGTDDELIDRVTCRGCVIAMIEDARAVLSEAAALLGALDAKLAEMQRASGRDPTTGIGSPPDGPQAA